jgi:hypothetical protein
MDDYISQRVQLRSLNAVLGRRLPAEGGEATVPATSLAASE